MVTLPVGELLQYISYQSAFHINYNLLMQRDNQTWLMDLRSEGEQRDNA